MPVINVEELTDLDKAKMEVTQLKVEVKLERAKVSVQIYSWSDYTKRTTSKLDGLNGFLKRMYKYAFFPFDCHFNDFFPSGVQML